VPSETERYLIICVDRDDDLGTKAKVETPVIGRDAALAAATKLALSDPEEADANAIFSSVKRYDELVGSGRDCEVAVVCGKPGRGFDADRTVAAEVAEVVRSTNPSGLVFVSDGADDEQVIPILQSFKPIVSLQRVTVKHSESVEESYLILGRYLRMLIFDPRYSKWTLGVPGMILLLSGILILSGQVFDAELATLLVLGGVFFVRGFSVDRTIAGLLHRGPTGYIRLFSTVTSVLVFLVGLFTGYGYMEKEAGGPGGIATMVAEHPNLFLVYGEQLVGYVMSGSLALVWAGMAIYSIGALLSHVARDSVRWRRDSYVLLMLALLYFPVQTFSAFLIAGGTEASYALISYVLIGLCAIFILTVTIYPRVRTKGTPTKD
jgi:putative membrane protein